MKKSTKIISLLLAVMMVVALMPTMAFAEDANSSDDVMGKVIDVVNGIQIPDYLVYCSLASRIPASHAKITLTNVNGDTSVTEANALGLALKRRKFPSDKPERLVRSHNTEHLQRLQSLHLFLIIIKFTCMLCQQETLYSKAENAARC